MYKANVFRLFAFGMRPFYSVKLAVKLRNMQLCESGANIKAIQGILGHSDITTTMDIYTDVTQEMRSEATVVLEKYLRM